MRASKVGTSICEADFIARQSAAGKFICTNNLKVIYPDSITNNLICPKSFYMCNIIVTKSNNILTKCKKNITFIEIFIL